MAFWRSEFSRGFEGVDLECEKVMETRVVSRFGEERKKGWGGNWKWLGRGSLKFTGAAGLSWGFAEEATSAPFRRGEFLDYTLIDWHY